jgi:hypothetical protein
MIRKQELATAYADYDQLICAYERLQTINALAFGEDIVSFLLRPQVPELIVIDKNVRCSWCIRAVDHVVESPVQEQRSPVSVEKH